MDNTQKFSGLADNYTAGRPAYADALIDCLYAQYGFTEHSVIADIGAGTGKFAKQLLDRGSAVYCVEPNDDMRNTAVAELGPYPGFRAVNGTAEATALGDASVDYITAAQAFHWFDGVPFKRECQRILRPGGRVFLIWNSRDLTSPVNQASFEIFSQYCPNFKGFGGGTQRHDVRIRQFFDDRYEFIEFDNPLVYDRDKFISRCLSGSYSLKAGDPRFDEYMAALQTLFETYAQHGAITMANQTVAYVGRLH